MILPYSEKVKLVDLSIDNPAWSWDQLKQVTGCHSYVRSRAHFLDIKRQILNDRNTYEKFKTINDWIYQSCVIENPDIMEITDAKLKSYTKRAKKVFSPEANEFSMTKGWVYYMKKRLGITDESNDFKPNVKQEPEKSGSKNVGIYLFKHSSSFEEDEAHDEDSDWSFNDNTEVLEDEEYHYVASGDDDDDDNDEATLSSKSCVDSKLSYENDNVDCKNIKKELKASSTNKYHDSDTNKDNKTILKEIIEPSAKKLKTNVSDEEKKRVVDMARKNPQWNLEQLKKESKCQELLFVSQLYDWQSQLEQNRPGSSKNIF
ncbi:probable ATP-dependent RNA helicase ddx52 [Aphidius gifuensis]|nr:probable ATP-dependent RNA helicase ddx52 [Aphidius gifuensis]